jgi:histidinol-phosphate aminotransferase
MGVKPKPQIVDLPFYQPGKPISDVKRELGLTEVVKLASNENPYGCSPLVREAIRSFTDQTHIYPDGGSMELRAALSEFLGVEPERIIFGAGADEIITMISRAFLQPGDETVMASHTFSQYRLNARVEAATIIEAPMKDGVHDLEGMLARIGEKTKIVWVCNPNNPTGTLVPQTELIRFLERVPSHVLVVLDEAYFEYFRGSHPDAPDGIRLLSRFSNMIVLRTFSKIYGLAALRVGYGVGSPDIIQLLNRVRNPFNTNAFGQTAAIAALKDQKFVEECHRLNREGMAVLTREFDRLGLAYYPSWANFVLVDTGRPAREMFTALLKKGVIVRGGHELGFPTSLRVTVGSPAENERFLTALTACMEEVSLP